MPLTNRRVNPQVLIPLLSLLVQFPRLMVQLPLLMIIRNQLVEVRRVDFLERTAYLVNWPRR